MGSTGLGASSAGSHMFLIRLSTLYPFSATARGRLGVVQRLRRFLGKTNAKLRHNGHDFSMQSFVTIVSHVSLKAHHIVVRLPSLQIMQHQNFKVASRTFTL